MWQARQLKCENHKIGSLYPYKGTGEYEDQFVKGGTPQSRT